MTISNKMKADILKPSFHNLSVMILILYLISEVTINNELFEVINEPMIKIILFAFSIYILFHRPIVGFLLIITLYELTTRNNKKIIPSLQAYPGKPSVITSPYSYVNYESMPTRRNRILRNVKQNNEKIPFETKVVKNMKSYYNEKQTKHKFNTKKHKKKKHTKSLEEKIIGNLKSNYNRTSVNNDKIQPVLANIS